MRNTTVWKLGFTTSAVLLFVVQTLFATIIPSDRVVTWQGNVGVPGGVPTNRTVYTTLAAGASQSQIQSALNSCPSNQAVLLSVGTYTISSHLIIPSYVTLRGAGPAQTTLTCSGGGGDDAIQFGPSSPNYPGSSYRAITGGNTKGSTAITVGSTSGFSVGSLMMIDQNNDPTFVTMGASPDQACGWCDNNNGSRTMGQMVLITNISGSTISFQPPLHWGYNLSPGATPASLSCQWAGVEDLKIEDTGGGLNSDVQFTRAYACWVKNIQIHMCAGDYLDINYSLRCEVRDSYFNDAWNHGPGGHDNDVALHYKASESLIENNIFYRSHVSIMFEWGASGNVISYNYSTNSYDNSGGTGWFTSVYNGHGAHPIMNLLEGNIGGMFRPDSTHGSDSHQTYLRNWGIGENWDPNGNVWEGAYGRNAFNFDHDTRSNNIIGNIAGCPKLVADGAVSIRMPPTGSGSAAWTFGYGSAGGESYDASPYTTAIFHGNYDFIANAQQWSTNTDHAIPNSYYLASKPAFFGNLAWPPIDPANPASVGIAATNHPAYYRFLYGTPPPGGPVNNPPVVFANAAPLNGRAPLAVRFYSTNSFDPEGTALTYNWTFGDGHTSTVANPTNTFSTAGTYVAFFTASDGTNTTQSANLTINVLSSSSNYPPVALASAATNAGPTPLNVAFSSAGSYDPDGTTLTYNWNFGDGTSSTAANPAHAYANSGLYTATLTCSDGTNNVAATPIAISAGNAFSGIVGAYGFDSGSGTAAADVSVFANNGSISGAVPTVNGRFGKALQFSSGSLVTVPDSPSLDVTSGLTVEAWVYPTALSGYMQVVIKPNGNPADINPCFILNGCSASTLGPSFYCSAASSNLFAPSALTMNTWTHLAATYDGAAMRIYVNGILAASRAQTGAMTTSTDALTIGGNAYSGQNWTGMIDEVKIYNRALSQNEIQVDMTTPIVGTAARPSPPGPPVVQ